MKLPPAFCWTKFGTEAGEAVSSIFRRKELERSRNSGTFLWGIGNSISPSISELIRVQPRPLLVFSPMLSAAAQADVNPAEVVLWTAALDLAGHAYRLPPYTVVTSGRGSHVFRRSHYALVCSSQASLLGDVARPSRVEPDLLRNLRTGSRLGASQVTAVVQAVGEGQDGPGRYSVAAVAELVYPYMVRLTNPVPVPADLVPRAASSAADLRTVTDRLIQSRQLATTEQLVLA